MENQFSLCISFFICEAEDVNFLPAFINALKRRGGGGGNQSYIHLVAY